jgi:uncharacterized protein (DUF1330 family)
MSLYVVAAISVHDNGWLSEYVEPVPQLIQQQGGR